ncbi:MULTISPECIES: helix-turn-helix transcriptional regulator [Bacillaceae]|uniref:helix-turn-helix domain-containing protein n=1 Tax=Bacillaceae TaxID=186817 RepID=UPI001E5986C7|nr:MULTISPECIES: helix-turn-helix transcriptional regulator [Bacillaceae]MCE4048736.1 helix-turn-helix transcriptional regulator [Bacillus sp. Au-Bac7]MCM3032870.1 helix-turn-helix transcriptional regulator [Niallia sp. MER 6]UPO90767.1 helix-turn-helix transcriptional regulator [Niallia sp. Man26]
MKNNQFAGELVNRLKELRLKRDWTIKHTAEKIGIGASMYSGYESQLRLPPMELLSKIAEVFDTTTDYLLGSPEKVEQTKSPTDIDWILSHENINYRGIELTYKDKENVKVLLEMLLENRMEPMNDVGCSIEEGRQ